MPEKLLIQAVENKTTINLDWIRYFAPNLQFRVYGRFVSKQGSGDPPHCMELTVLPSSPRRLLRQPACSTIR
jgi:hypothetical protein